MSNEQRDLYSSDDESKLYVEDSEDDQTILAQRQPKVATKQSTPKKKREHHKKKPASTKQKDEEAQSFTEPPIVDFNGVWGDDPTFYTKSEKRAIALRRWKIRLSVIIIVPLLALAIALPIFLIDRKDGSEAETNVEPELQGSGRLTAPPVTSTPTSAPHVETPSDKEKDDEKDKEKDDEKDTENDTTKTDAPTHNPSFFPTDTPTAAPTTFLHSQILPILKSASKTPDRLENPLYAHARAVEWLRLENEVELTSEAKIIQRYTIVLLQMTLEPIDPTKIGFLIDPATDECSWYGVECDENSKDKSLSPVIAIKWPAFGLNGELPDDIGLLNSLQTLDLAENEIHGTLPDGLYSLTQLEYLYLQSNRLQGAISSDIEQLPNLKRVFLGNNLISGPLPAELGTLQNEENVRPLEWLSLYNNTMTGTIPQNLMWSNLYYLDLGHNGFSGFVPQDWPTDMTVLRSLYLDHNEFEGQVSKEFTSIGNGLLEQLVLNDNQFTGEVPSKFQTYGSLKVFEVHHNDFQKMKDYICGQIKFAEEGGEVVVFHADCDICQCDFFCNEGQCYDNN